MTLATYFQHNLAHDDTPEYQAWFQRLGVLEGMANLIFLDLSRNCDIFYCNCQTLGLVPTTLSSDHYFLLYTFPAEKKLYRLSSRIKHMPLPSLHWLIFSLG